MIIDDLDVLDAPAAAISGALGPVMRSPAKPLLRGDWLGHALHPLLSDIPIGTFTSALLLDLLGADEDAAAALLGAGVVATPAVIITGWSDWHEEEAGSAAIRRSGIVHALLNATGVGLQIASLAARRDDERARGTVLTAVGLGLMGAAGWLGGHMTYVKGSRVETESASPDL